MKTNQYQRKVSVPNSQKLKKIKVELESKIRNLESQSLFQTKHQIKVSCFPDLTIQAPHQVILVKRHRNVQEE